MYHNMYVELPASVDSKEELVNRAKRITELSKELTAELLKLPLTGNYYNKDGKVRFTLNGIICQKALMCLDGLTKAISDVDASTKRELSELMLETGQKHISMTETETGRQNVYDFEKERTVRQIDYDRLEKNHPELYQKLIDGGYIKITRSEPYAMKRTPTTLNAERGFMA